MRTTHILLTGLLVSCTQQQAAKMVADGAPVAIKIAEDVCEELKDEGGAPEWVTLACQGAKVLMPRAQWHAMMVKKLDAGPGK